MISSLSRKQKTSSRIFTLALTIVFVFNTFLSNGLAQIVSSSLSASPLNLPLNIHYQPSLLVGLQLNTHNPFQLDFLIDRGENPPKPAVQKDEYTKLIKYFLAALTIPQDHLWVNLSPKEKERIISDDFSKTTMGIDLLGQDYLLKKISSSLLYPEGEIGKKFWERVYSQLGQHPELSAEALDLLNRVWIVPDKAIIYEDGNTVWVVDSYLKVKMEGEYESEQWTVNGEQKKQHFDSAQSTVHGSPSTEIIKQILLPEIEREVNYGPTFAALRQIYQSMILATWYKRALKESVLSQVYIDHGKVEGVNHNDQEAKLKIYNKYIEAFKKGFYETIVEEYDPQAQDVIARKYISGGFDPKIDLAMLSVKDISQIPPGRLPLIRSNYEGLMERGLDRVPTNLETVQPLKLQPTDAAMEAQVPDYSRASAGTLVGDYYGLKQQMTEAIDQEDMEKYRRLRQQMLGLVEYLSANIENISDEELRSLLTQHVQGKGAIPGLIGIANQEGVHTDLSVIRTELLAVGQIFNPPMTALINTIVDEVVSELFDEVNVQRKLKEQLLKDIKLFNFSSFVPDYQAGVDFKQWQEETLGLLSNITEGSQSWGAYIPYLKNIVLHANDNELIVRSTLKHEIVHYLADHNIIKIPPRWEQITYAVDVIERVTHAGQTLAEGEAKLSEYSQEFGESALAELYSRGKEMGLSGQTGFMVTPGISDRQAGYFSIEYLLMEARNVYEHKGLSVEVLNDPYHAQKAAGILIGGIMMGMSEKSQAKPLTLLKDFFDVLYDRYADPTLDNPALKSKIDQMIKDVEQYATILAGQRVTLKPTLKGFWSYESVSEFEGVLHYVPTDLFPRMYDGQSQDDLEGQTQAARERVLGLTFLALSQKKFGLHRLVKQLPKEVQTSEGLLALWDAVLLPRVAVLSLSFSAQAIVTMDKKFEGSERWLMRVFRDRYSIGNQFVEEALLTSLPLHLQYLDSLLYRRFHYDPQIKSIADTRLKNKTVEDAVARSAGSQTDEADFGWIKVMFQGDQLKDRQIVDIIGKKLWPVYQELFEEALKNEQRWRAYQRKMREEKQEAVREAFNQLSQDVLDQLDQYFGQLPEDAQQAIQEDVKQMMEEALDQFMNQSSAGLSPMSQALPQMGQGTQSSGGQPSLSPIPGSPGKGKSKTGDALSTEELTKKLEQLEQDLQHMESQLGSAAQNVQAIKSQTSQIDTKQLSQKDLEAQRDLAQELNSKTQEIQQQTQSLMNQGRGIAKEAQDQQAGYEDVKQGLLSPEEGKESGQKSQALQQKAQELLNKMRELMNTANQLNKGAQSLADKLSEPEPDGTQVMGQTRQLDEAAEQLKNHLDQTEGKNRDLVRSIHELEESLKDLEQSIQQPSPSAQEGASGETQPSGGSKVQSSATAKQLQSMPPKLEIEGAKDFQQMLTPPDSKNTSKIKPIEVPPFDLAKAQQREEEQLKNRTGLNREQREELERWKDIKLQGSKGGVTVRELIDQLTTALKVLTFPTVDIDYQNRLTRGPILDDLVGALIGDPAYAKWNRKDPLPVKISLLIDTSGSMGERNDIDTQFTPIEIARIMTLILLSAFFEHNEERELKGYQPIEFEVGLFSDDQGRLQISHETTRVNNFRKERVLYETWRALTASGGTYYAKNLHKYSERLYQAQASSDEKEARILLALTDEDVEPYQQQEVLGTIQAAEEKKVNVFIVPLGNSKMVQQTQALHHDHPERIINPRPYQSLPFNIMNAFLNAIEPPAPGHSWLDTTEDAAMMAKDDSIGELKPITGYKHFFTQVVRGRTFLVFQRNGFSRYWERGLGGAQVPATIVPDIGPNEDKMVSLMDILYRPNSAYTSYSGDGRYLIQVVHDGLTDVLEKQKDGTYQSLHRFSPQGQIEKIVSEEQIIIQNAQGLRWKKDSLTQELLISQENGDFKNVLKSSEFNPEEWMLYEQDPTRILAFSPQTNQVLIISLKGDTWTIEHELRLEEETRGESWDGKFARSIGETGLGKDELTLAAAHLMNEEVYFLTGHGDIDVEDIATGFRAVGTKEAGTSSFDPSGYNKVMHNGGWYIIREAHKLRPGVLNSLKSHVTGKDHKWPIEREGIERLETFANHPRARLIASVNRIRPGIEGYSTETNAPMQDRIADVEFYWQKPQDEIEWQLAYAIDLAKKLGRHPDDWDTFEARLRQDIISLVDKAAQLRLAFAGYNAQQQAAIMNDWELIDSNELVKKMAADPHIEELFKNGPAFNAGQMLKRPPSPRVIQHIIRHFITFESDWNNRPLTTVQNYYNFRAEVDRQNTYSGALTAFESWRSDRDQQPLVLNESSFQVSGENLIVTPQGWQKDGPNAWDRVVVPLHPQASIRQNGKVPAEVLDWLQIPANTQKFYVYLQAHALKMHAIFVGKPGSGKSTMTEAIQKLLNGPGKLKLEITEETRDDSVTFKRNLQQFRTLFTKEILPSAMNDRGYGQILNMDESTQGRPSMLSLLNEVSARNVLPDPTTEEQSLEGKEGFGIIHTINPPGSADRLRAFGDDFVERHMIIEFDTPPPEQMLVYLLEASQKKDFISQQNLRVNPRILGEPIKDTNGQVAKFPDGEVRYSGIIGVAQLLRRWQLNDPTTFPKNRDVSIRNLQAFVKKLIDDYGLEESGGKDSKDILVDIFQRSFTLEGDNKRLIKWRGNILRAFEEVGMWTKTKGGLDEYLQGEAVILESLPIIREAQTSTPDLNRKLNYLQTNTLGRHIGNILDDLYKVSVKALSEENWKKKELAEKIAVINYVKEIYQILKLVLEHRTDPQQGPIHTSENISKIEAILAFIRAQLILNLHWPKEVLELSSKLQNLPKFSPHLVTGLADIDEMIWRVFLFDTDEQYTAEEISRLKEKILAVRDNRVPTLSTILTVLEKLNDPRFTSLISDLKKEIERLTPKSLGNEYSKQLLELEAEMKIVEAQLKDLKTSPVSAEPLYGAPYNLPEGELAVELTKIVKDNHGDDWINSLSTYTTNGQMRWVSLGGGGKVFEYILQDEKIRTAQADEEVIAKLIRENHEGSSMYSLSAITINGQPRWVSMDDIGRVFEYILEEGSIRTIKSEDEVIANLMKENHGKNWIFSLSTLTINGQQRWVSLGDRGLVFEYIQDKGTIRKAGVQEEVIAQLMKENHGNNEIASLSTITINGQPRWVSMGERGRVFEYIQDKGTIRKGGVQEEVIAQLMKENHGNNWINSLSAIMINGQPRLVSMGIIGNAFSYGQDVVVPSGGSVKAQESEARVKEMAELQNKLTALQAKKVKLETLLQVEETITTLQAQIKTLNDAQSSQPTSEPIYGAPYNLPEVQLTKLIKKNHEEEQTFSLNTITINGQTRWVSTGSGEKVFEYILDDKGKTRNARAGEEVIAKLMKENHGRNDILSLSTYTINNQTRWVSMGSEGKVFEYILDKGKIRKADLDEEVIAQLMEENHGKNGIFSLSTYTINGQTRWVSMGSGSEGKVFEYILLYGKKIRKARAGEEVIAKLIKENYGGNSLYSLSTYTINDQTRWVSVGADGLGLANQKVFEYILDGKKIRKARAGEEVIAQLMKENHGIGKLSLNTITIVIQGRLVSRLVSMGEYGGRVFMYAQEVDPSSEEFSQPENVGVIDTLKNQIKILEAQKKSLEDKGDAAVLAEKPDELGGIDLNPDQLDLQIRQMKNQYPLLFTIPSDFNRSFTGLVPVIINIIPAELPLFMSNLLKEDRDLLEKQRASL